MTSTSSVSLSSTSNNNNSNNGMPTLPFVGPNVSQSNRSKLNMERVFIKDYDHNRDNESKSEVHHNRNDDWTKVSMPPQVTSTNGNGNSSSSTSTSSPPGLSQPFNNESEKVKQYHDINLNPDNLPLDNDKLKSVYNELVKLTSTIPVQDDKDKKFDYLVQESQVQVFNFNLSDLYSYPAASTSLLDQTIKNKKTDEKDEKEKPKTKVEEHAHPLYIHFYLDQSNHHCDYCKKILDGQYGSRCHACNWDMCTECKLLYLTSSSMDTKTMIKEVESFKNESKAQDSKYEYDSESDYDDSEYESDSDSDSHIGYVSNPENKYSHVHPLYTSAYPSGTNYHCDYCKKNLDGQRGYRCQPCNWDMCMECKEKSNSIEEALKVAKEKAKQVKESLSSSTPANMITTGHPHQLYINTYPSGSNYHCDSCKKNLDGQRAHRCQPCNWDMCMECKTNFDNNASKVKVSVTETKVPETKSSKKLTSALPSHGHLLTYYNELKNNNCDVCGQKDIKMSFRCDICDWDACYKCFIPHLSNSIMQEIFMMNLGDQTKLKAQFNSASSSSSSNLPVQPTVPIAPAIPVAPVIKNVVPTIKTIKTYRRYHMYDHILLGYLRQNGISYETVVAMYSLMKQKWISNENFENVLFKLISTDTVKVVKDSIQCRRILSYLVNHDLIDEDESFLLLSEYEVVEKSNKYTESKIRLKDLDDILGQLDMKFAMIQHEIDDKKNTSVYTDKQLINKSYNDLLKKENQLNFCKLKMNIKDSKSLKAGKLSNELKIEEYYGLILNYQYAEHILHGLYKHNVINQEEYVTFLKDWHLVCHCKNNTVVHESNWKHYLPIE